MLGLSIGEIVWLTAAILGLAFIAKTFALRLPGAEIRRRGLSRLPRLADVDRAGACRGRAGAEGGAPGSACSLRPFR